MTRKAKETHTLQVWPGGQSYEYRGDPDGPENQRSLRKGHYRARLRCPDYCSWLFLDDHGRALGLTDGDPRLGQYVSIPGGDNPASWPDLVARGVVCPTCKGKGYTDNPERNPWRKGTPDEWRKIRIELRAELYGSCDIFGCDSSLVTDLIAAADERSASESAKDLQDGFSYDEIRNLYKDPSDWTLEQCRDYIRDLGDEDAIGLNPWTMSREEIVEALEAVSIECKDDETIETLREALIANIDDETIAGLDDWRDAARELAQDNPAEVYEWWRVSSWLCDQLHAIGEVTIDNGYGHWWGRTCTGQGWIMDGTLQEIAARFEKDGE